MPLNDSQLVGLLQVVILQEHEIIELKIAVLALSRIAAELSGGDVVPRLEQLRQEIFQSTKFDGSRGAIDALEQIIVQLLPTSGAKN